MTIDEINKQINELQNKRDEIIRDKYKERNEEISKLAWTKHHRARLKLEPIYGAGLPRYKIEVWDNPPSMTGSIVVYSGDNYHKHVFYGKKYLEEGYEFSSYDPESILKFLDGVVFKSLEYGKDDLHFLKRVSEIAERMGK